MKFIIKLLIILFPVLAFSATKYVDNFAPAGGDGSINVPYNSLNTAFQHLNPGDTLYIRGTNSGDGQIYFGDIELPISGHPSAQITLMNYENEAVIFSIFSRFDIDKDYWSFEGITFEDNNSVILKMKIAGENNRFKNCVFRGYNLDEFKIEGQKKNIFEYCKTYNISR